MLPCSAQVAEKYLKAYLVHVGVGFPFTHNLTKLVELCQSVDPEFSSLLAVVEWLTPYAVETRYDSEFWPDERTAEDAGERATAVRDFVSKRLQGV